MKLFSGKNLEQFENWYKKQKGLPNIMWFKITDHRIQLGVFKSYINKATDYYIEVVMGINLKSNEFDGYDWRIVKIQKDNTVKELYSGWNEFEEEAYTEAFKKFDILINSQLYENK